MKLHALDVYLQLINNSSIITTTLDSQKYKHFWDHKTKKYQSIYKPNKATDNLPPNMKYS